MAHNIVQITHTHTLLQKGSMREGERYVTSNIHSHTSSQKGRERYKGREMVEEINKHRENDNVVKKNYFSRLIRK